MKRRNKRPNRCKARTEAGTQCQQRSSEDSRYCSEHQCGSVHLGTEQRPPIPCSNPRTAGSRFCMFHMPCHVHYFGRGHNPPLRENLDVLRAAWWAKRTEAE
jgi:hypothetical protein